MKTEAATSALTTVQQVGDARSEYARLMRTKNKDAEWVTGLEDEAALAEYFRRSEQLRRQMLRKQQKRVARGLGGANGLKVPDVDVSSDSDVSDFEVLQGEGGYYSRSLRTSGGGKSKKGSKKGDGAFVGAVKEYGSELLASLTQVRTAWLRVPLAFLTLATVMLLFQHVSYYDVAQRFNHPPSEVALWPFCRANSWLEFFAGGFSAPTPSPSSARGAAGAFSQSAANLVSYFPQLTFFHLFASLATITLGYKLGGAAQNFPALCGVGCGILALIATLLDAFLAIRACPHGAIVEISKPCDYPFGSHWALSCFKNVGATVGVCLAAQVFDLVTPAAKGAASFAAEAVSASPASGRTSLIVTAIPAVLHALFYASSFLLNGGINRGNNQYVLEAGQAAAAASGGKGKRSSPSAQQQKKGGGNGGSSSNGSGGGSIQDSLAYYASLAQLIAWALLIPSVYVQRRLTSVPRRGGGGEGDSQFTASDGATAANVSDATLPPKHTAAPTKPATAGAARAAGPAAAPTPAATAAAAAPTSPKGKKVPLPRKKRGA